MATNKQIKFFNELKRQGRTSPYSSIDDKDTKEAWEIISKMLRKNGDGSVDMDDDLNNEIVSTTQDAEKAGFDENQRIINSAGIVNEDDMVSEQSKVRDEINENLGISLYDSKRINKSLRDEDYQGEDNITLDEAREQYGLNKYTDNPYDFDDDEYDEYEEKSEEEFDQLHDKLLSDNYQNEEGTDNYYRRTSDIQSYASDYAEKAKQFKDLQENKADAKKVKDAYALGEDTLIDPYDLNEKDFKEAIGIPNLEVNFSNSTSSIYFSYEEDNENIEFAIGDHYIQPGFGRSDLNYLEPGEIQRDQKYDKWNDMETETLKMGMTKNGGIKLNDFRDLIKEAREDRGLE